MANRGLRIGSGKYRVWGLGWKDWALSLLSTVPTRHVGTPLEVESHKPMALSSDRYFSDVPK